MVESDLNVLSMVGCVPRVTFFLSARAPRNGKQRFKKVLFSNCCLTNEMKRSLTKKKSNKKKNLERTEMVGQAKFPILMLILHSRTETVHCHVHLKPIHHFDLPNN